MKAYTLEELEELRKGCCKDVCGDYHDPFECCPIKDFIEWLREGE